jgi:hypothetical protein
MGSFQLDMYFLQQCLFIMVLPCFLALGFMVMFQGGDGTIFSVSAFADEITRSVSALADEITRSVSALYARCRMVKFNNRFKCIGCVLFLMSVLLLLTNQIIFVDELKVRARRAVLVYEKILRDDIDYPIDLNDCLRYEDLTGSVTTDEEWFITDTPEVFIRTQYEFIDSIHYGNLKSDDDIDEIADRLMSDFMNQLARTKQTRVRQFCLNLVPPSFRTSVNTMGEFNNQCYNYYSTTTV